MKDDLDNNNNLLNFFYPSTNISTKNNNAINYEDYIKSQTTNNQQKNIIHPNNKIIHNNPRPLNMNSLYFNMFQYNLLSRNQYNSTKINSLLLDFNNQLEKEEEQKIKESKKEKSTNNKSTNLQPLINKLESQDDPRFKQSRFLKFIKDINSQKIKINQEKNIIEENTNYKNDQNDFEDNTNTLNDLLNKVKMYIDYNREDLARDILDQIFDNIG